MMRISIALLSGLVFGAGLAIAGMLDPSKIAGFLDIFGRWDPSLAFVMAGGVAVNLIACRLVLPGGLFKLERPFCADSFSLPTTSGVDRQLVAGSIVFGVGWGITGLCPGPAIASAAINEASGPLFLLVLLAGIWAGRLVLSMSQSPVSGAST